MIYFTAHTFKCVCHCIRTMFRVLSVYNFANCINIFHKTEVQTVILMCLTGQNHNWFKSYDTKSIASQGGLQNGGNTGF